MFGTSDIRDVDISIDGDWATLTGTVALTANAYGSRGTHPLPVRQMMHRVDGCWQYSKRV